MAFHPATVATHGLRKINVKSGKYHIKRTLRQSHLNFEERYILLARIEAILNSHSMTPVSTDPSSDPNDLQALTPSQSLEEDRKDQQHFRQRWSKEYQTQHLTRLNARKADTSQVHVGDLVVLIEKTHLQ